MHPNNAIADNRRPLLAKPGAALLLLFSLFAFFLILTPIITGLLGKIIDKPASLLRIAMMLQDILVFIFPALLMAVVSTRLPARLLAIDERPAAAPLMLSLLTLVFSIPVMNYIVEWNASISFPEQLKGLESLMREMEASAQAVTDSLMAGASVPSLLVSVLIVGVFAGFSEELFFRGAMQRTMLASRLNMHAAVWIVAFVFSLFHFQFFGFIPRLLLGAYFGYLLWWTGSLWIPVAVHVFNNSLVVVNEWHTLNNPDAINANEIGTVCATYVDMAVILLSIVLTMIGMVAIYRTCRKQNA